MTNPPKDTPYGDVFRGLQDLLSAILTLLKIVAIACALYWGYSHSEFIETWLWGLTSGEVAGLKFQREVFDEASTALAAYSERVAACHSAEDSFCLDKTFGEDAIQRASRVAPAIVDARILWVDDKPEQNAPIANILQKMGMRVETRNWTQDALNALKVAPYDVIITNVWRPRDPDQRKRSLTVCPVHYFDFPRGLDTSSFFRDEDLAKDKDQARALALERFNADANLHGAAGFGLADTVLADWGNDDSVPQIIFFTAENARVARPLCGYRITNRGDVLLNAIVSILEQRYSKRLVVKPWQAKQSSDD
jgi:CheY-like chemotaxis protein